jgi:hypothetical protein
MPIQQKRSLTSGSIPTTASLAIGELAMNIPDGKIFFRKSGSGSDTIESAITTGAQNSGSVVLSGSLSIYSPTGSGLQINGDVFEISSDVIEFTGSFKVTGSVVINNSSIDTAWTSYTPVWTAASTNPVIGNGTITGAYKVIGKTCFVRARVVMGSSTTYGSGAWYISLPVSASTAYTIIMPATMLDNGTNWYSATVNGGRLGSTSRSEIQWQNTSGVAVSITSTVPFTWGSTDEFEFNGSYEIA